MLKYDHVRLHYCGSSCDGSRDFEFGVHKKTHLRAKSQSITQDDHEKFKDDPAALVASLKACAKENDLNKGSEIHAYVRQHGFLRKNTYVGNALITFYAKCGAFRDAKNALSELQARDVVSWNALISGYVQHGHGHEALGCFEEMQRDGLSPNAVTYTSTLKACGIVGALKKGEAIYAEVVKRKVVQLDAILGNAVVDMYAKCGVLDKAQELLHELPARNVITWSALIAGYIQQGYNHSALNCYEQMKHEGLSPNAVVFACLLKACGNIGAAAKGEEIYEDVVRRGLLAENNCLGNALLDMYVKCGVLVKAQKVFDELSVQDVAAWTALIAGYAQHGHSDEAVNCFDRMQLKGVSPNAVTFTCVLKACSSLGAWKKGAEIHTEVARQRLIVKDVMLGNALVDMYAKCGAVVKAKEVFDELEVHNVVSWNALIAGYVYHEHAQAALNCFDHMKNEGFLPNSVTFICILKVCGSVEAGQKGEEIHAEVVERGLLENDTALGNALMDMYVKCNAMGKAQVVFGELLGRDVVSYNVLIAGYTKDGALAEAQRVFDDLPLPDVVSWSTLMLGYAQHGYDLEAINYFEKMQQEGLSSGVVLPCILQACGNIGAVEKVEELHALLVRQKLLKDNLSLGSGLVDAYAKCGLLLKAHEVFDELPDLDVVAWSSLMTGYVLVGNVVAVFNSFNKMIMEGIEPDLVSFITMLSVCRHLGLVEEGLTYFEVISARLSVFPTCEHHICMIDLFGRAGQFDKAIEFLKDIPLSKSFDSLLLWSTLLGACQKWENEELGSLAFDHLIQLEDKNVGAYICMSNIYAAAHMKSEADGSVRDIRRPWNLLPHAK